MPLIPAIFDLSLLAEHWPFFWRHQPLYKPVWSSNLYYGCSVPSLTSSPFRGVMLTYAYSLIQSVLSIASMEDCECGFIFFKFLWLFWFWAICFSFLIPLSWIIAMIFCCGFIFSSCRVLLSSSSGSIFSQSPLFIFWGVGW